MPKILLVRFFPDTVYMHCKVLKFNKFGRIIADINMGRYAVSGATFRQHF